MTKLFISDIHLNPEKPVLQQGLVRFLQEQASQADELYILGDLFEYWLGDDCILPGVAVVMDALLCLTQQHGVKIFIMHGNRDFLLGSQFMEKTGCQLLNQTPADDEALITVDGDLYLLMHGDTLCTQDEPYMAFRQRVRNKSWQVDFLSMTIQQRLDFAQQARAKSTEHTAAVTMEICDVYLPAVLQLINKYEQTDSKIKGIIHGHTHRPAVHNIRLENNRVVKRIVLSDWSEEYGQVLEWKNDGFSLRFFNILAD